MSKFELNKLKYKEKKVVLQGFFRTIYLSLSNQGTFKSLNQVTTIFSSEDPSVRSNYSLNGSIFRLPHIGFKSRSTSSTVTLNSVRSVNVEVNYVKKLVWNQNSQHTTEVTVVYGVVLISVFVLFYDVY